MIKPIEFKNKWRLIVQSFFQITNSLQERYTYTFTSYLYKFRRKRQNTNHERPRRFQQLCQIGHYGEFKVEIWKLNSDRFIHSPFSAWLICALEKY